MALPDDAESVRYVYAAAAVYVRKGDIATGRRLSEEALARARRHGLTDLAAAIERDLRETQVGYGLQPAGYATSCANDV